MSALDETDIKILRLLQDNAKLTHKEIATEVNLSPSPIFERLKRLEREGFIKKYTAVVDAKKAGNSLMVFCNVRLKEHNKACGMRFMQAIDKLEEVNACYNTSGDYDFMMKLYMRDMDHYQDFVLNKLGKIDSIGSLQSIFVIGEAKSPGPVPVR